MTRRRTSILLRLAGAMTVGVLFVAACGSSSPGVEVGRSEAFEFDVGTVADDPPDTTAPPDEPATTTPGDTTPITPDTVAPDAAPPATTAPPDTLPPMMEVPTSTIPLDGPFPYDPDKPAQPFDGLMVATIQDLEIYWAETMPQVFGFEYEPLAGGVFPAYPERDDYPDGCYSTYDEIEANGFYCPTPYDYISWDDVGYVKAGWDSHGSGAITALMSHEWGHAVQNRTGVFNIVPEVSTPVVELQADCYSGAWFGRIARGESDLLTFSDTDIRSGIIDTVLSADPVGYSPTDEGAHGAGFDRVSAFQDGFNRGAAQCATYVDAPPVITEFGFTEEEMMRPDPGDLSFEESLELMPADLNGFWMEVLPGAFTALSFETFDGSAPACDGISPAVIENSLAIFCPSLGSVLINAPASAAAVERFGDFSLGYFLGAAWADAAQTVAGTTLTGEERVLYNDCLVGVWALDISPMGAQSRDLLLSPGDLDEAVATALLIADDTADEDVQGDAFAKIDAFRAGVLGAIDGCNARI